MTCFGSCLCPFRFFLVVLTCRLFWLILSLFKSVFNLLLSHFGLFMVVVVCFGWLGVSLVIALALFGLFSLALVHFKALFR